MSLAEMNSWISSTYDSAAEEPDVGVPLPNLGSSRSFGGLPPDPAGPRAGPVLNSVNYFPAIRFLSRVTLLALAAFIFVPSPGGEAATKPFGIDPFCNAAVDGKDTRSLEQSQITRLDVAVLDARKWAKNNFKIMRTRSKTILPKHKKRFDAAIVAHFANGLTCKFKARVRQNGDWKDHIQFKNGNFINSLDVRLNEGHLNGVVRFKLLIPDTREGENEVILVTLLKSAGFLAPRTSLLKVDLMGQSVEMIFQEKQRKEMLEDNYLREGPLLEGDERFTWATTEIKGMSAKAFDDSLVFSRLTNNNWAAKGPNSLEISKDAVRRLNAGYLKSGYLSHIKGEDNVRTYFDNYLLANGDPAQLQHLNEYNALLQAANASHALRPHNRMFYYDPMYGYFHPIYYDGMAQLGRLALPGAKNSFGISKFAVLGAPGALKIVEGLKPQDFLIALRKAGLNLNKSRVASILRRLKENLSLIGRLDIPDYSSVTSPAAADYIKAIQRRRREDISFIQFSEHSTADTCDLCPANACDLSLKSCKPIKLDIEESGELLAGKLRVKNKPTLFHDIGPVSAPTSEGDKRTRLTRAVAPDVDVTTSAGMKVSEDPAARTITFQQSLSSDWALLRGGSLDGVTILFEGTPKTEKTSANAQRFNTRLLTGCLSLVDMTVNKLSVVVGAGGCEDGVNMVRVKGQVNSIKVSNTVSDAVDIDFSEITFDEIDVKNTDNDCIDLSAGKYLIKSVNAHNCGDKGISIGEGARLHVERAQIEKAVIGVAVKDSSQVSITKLQVRGAKTCVAAYRKKQEFSGGIARITETTCNGGAIHADFGSAVVARGTP